MTSPLRLPALVVLLLLALTTACGSDDTTTPKAKSADCTYKKSAQPAAKAAELPPGSLPKDAPTEATISTNRGDIKVSLETKTAPCAVNSFLSLGKQGYFVHTKCHRLHIQDYFVLQCGDPSGTGGGGPGYEFPDEISGQETYTAGTLAMANSGPDTNGSQFFVVFADSGFPPDYTVFGHMNAAGVTLVQNIAKEGIGIPSNNPQLGAGDGTPKNPVIIKSVK